MLAGVGSRDLFSERLSRLRALPAVGVPFQRGGRWFQARSAGLAAQRVREVESGQDLADVLEWSTGHAWPPDSSGFYYTRAPAPAAGREYTQASAIPQVFFHRVGSSQDCDELILALDDSGQWPQIAISADGRYLIVSLSRGLGSGDELRVLDLVRPERGWRLLIPEGQHRYAVAGTQDGTFYLLPVLVGSRTAGKKTAGVRRLLRMCPVAGQVGLVERRADRDQRRIQRRPAGRGVPDPAS